MKVLHSNLHEYVNNLGLVDSFLPKSTVNFYGRSAERFLEVYSAEGGTQSSVLLAQPGRCVLLPVLGMRQRPVDSPGKTCRMTSSRNVQDFRILGL